MIIAKAVQNTPKNIQAKRLFVVIELKLTKNVWWYEKFLKGKVIKDKNVAYMVDDVATFNDDIFAIPLTQLAEKA